jgi:hypothetical protein
MTTNERAENKIMRRASFIMFMIAPVLIELLCKGATTSTRNYRSNARACLNTYLLWSLTGN